MTNWHEFYPNTVPNTKVSKTALLDDLTIVWSGQFKPIVSPYALNNPNFWLLQ